MNYSSNLSLYQLIRLALTGQPGLFQNLSAIDVHVYELHQGLLYFCITKYYTSGIQRTWYVDSKKTFPKHLSNLAFVQKLFRYGHVTMTGRKVDVFIYTPSSIELMDAFVSFFELQSRFQSLLGV